MLGWLRRLVGGKRAEVEDPTALSTAEAAAADAADAAYQAEVEGRPPPPAPLSDRADAPAEAWATALGVEIAALQGRPLELAAEEARLAAAVLDHFDTHRPGPTSFPAISLQIYELTRDPDVAIGELARVVGMDAALSAGVLVLANSPAYRGLTILQTPREAIARLGLAEVSRLVTALSTRSLFLPQLRVEFETFGPAWNRLFYHSAVVARTASSLAAARRLPGGEQAFVGGMLHDVGKAIALRSLAALVFEGRVGLPEPDSVARVLHHVHVEVGGQVHQEWRLPEPLVALAVHHHEVTLPANPELAGLHLVRLVSALHLLGSAPGLHPAAPVEIVDSARALGLGPARVQALARELEENGEWVRLLFGEESGGPATAR